MEVNAAAAMAKFKSFRAPIAVKEPEKEVPLVATSSPAAEVDASDTVVMDPTTEAAVAEACAGKEPCQDIMHAGKSGSVRRLVTITLCY